MKYLNVRSFDKETLIKKSVLFQAGIRYIPDSCKKMKFPANGLKTDDITSILSDVHLSVPFFSKDFDESAKIIANWIDFAVFQKLFNSEISVLSGYNSTSKENKDMFSGNDVYRLIYAVEECNAESEAFIIPPNLYKGKQIAGYPVYQSKHCCNSVFNGMWSDIIVRTSKEFKEMKDDEGNCSIQFGLDVIVRHDMAFARMDNITSFEVKEPPI